jgi:hypothetical protein
MAERDEAAMNAWRIRPSFADAAETAGDGDAGVDSADGIGVDADTAGTEDDCGVASAAAHAHGDQVAAREVDIDVVAKS